MREEIQELLMKVNSFPEEPGVYLFKDKNERVIYVGKAKVLRRRVKSYFAKVIDRKVEKIQELAKDVEFIVTNSETEALILENNLIKLHKPILNARLKDDKTYPYLKITTSEEIPRVEIVRKRDEGEDLYFGPYSNVKSLRLALKKALTIFPIARCKKKIVYGKEERSCLYYQMDRCLAPCAAKIDLQQYKMTVNKFIKLFEGKQQILLEDMRTEMEELSNNLEFEKAAQLRDKLIVLEEIVKKQTIVSKDPTAEYDILGLVKEEGYSLLQILLLRQGRIVEQKHFIIDLPFELEEAEILGTFIKQYYSKTEFIADRILTRVKVLDEEMINQWLKTRVKGYDKKRELLVQPQTEEEKDFVELAYHNAKSNLTMNVKMDKLKAKGITEALEELKNLIELETIPNRIEGYDISTLQGTETVGSCVVFVKGYPMKKNYRKFIVKTIEKQDDFASLQEVIRRRFTGSLSKKEKNPDLILIDGGKGQVSNVHKEMKRIGIEIPMIGLAKEHEEIHYPDKREPLILDKRTEALKLLQRIRDEAHRFAISFHRQRRSKSMIKTSLEDIPGLGPKKIEKLLEFFETIKNVKKATIEEIERVPGITRALAEKIVEYYKNNLEFE